MVEELKLAIKVDDDAIEQSLLKQFANAEKMANKVVLTFNNIDLDDKAIEAKFKEMQKMAGKNPIDLSIDKSSIEMLSAISKQLANIFDIAKGKSIIDSSATAQIDKLQSKLDELTKKYDELSSKKIGSTVSGKDIDLVDNEKFKSLSENFEKIKRDIDELRTHMSLLDDYTVDSDSFLKLETQVDGLSVKIDDLIGKYIELSNVQKNIGTDKSNISSVNSTVEVSQNDEVTASIRKKKEELASYELQLEETRYEIEKLAKSENTAYGFSREYSDKQVESIRNTVTDSIFAKPDNGGRKGSNKWFAPGNLTDISASALKSYQMWQEELQKVGYTLSKIRDTGSGLEADILPIDGKAITNAEEFRKALDSITTVPSENVELLNKQITELEVKISSLKSEISSLESSKNSPMKDVFQGDKIDQATTSAKELDKTLEQVNIPTDSFDEVLSKLDRTKSELGEIVKITKQSVSDSEGKFHNSYTLKDKHGSTEIYGLSSNTEKGQLLRSNIVGYDAKAEAQEAKRLVEENIRLNKAYYDSKKQEEAEYQRLRAKYLAEGKAQEEKYYADLKRSRELTLKSYQDQINSFDKQIPKKPIDGQRSDKFEGFVQDYKNAIEEARKYLNTLGDSPVTKEVKDEWERLITVIKKAKEEMDAVPNAARGSDADARMKEIDKLTKYLDKNTRISKEAREQLEGYLALLKSGDPSVNVKELHTAWTKVAVAEREAGREGKSFLDIFKNKVVYNYAAQLAGYYLSFMDMIRYARNAVSAVQELDTALIDLKKTTTMSASELERFYYDSNDVAKQMDTTTAEIINQASAWSRLGYSTKEASTQMAELSAQFAAISPDLDLDSATDGLVSSMKAFDIEVTNVERDIMDNINRIGNTAATSNGEIVDMLTRSSAAMAAANNTIQETIALETAAVEITRNAETTGTAFKTLSMRIRGRQTLPPYTVMYMLCA